MIVEGEPGVGETRLVHELLAHPSLADRQVMVGHCHPLSEPFPFGVVSEALRSLAGRPKPALPGRRRAAAAAAGLDDVLPPPPAPIGDPHAERHRLPRAAPELCWGRLAEVDDPARAATTHTYPNRQTTYTAPAYGDRPRGQQEHRRQ